MPGIQRLDPHVMTPRTAARATSARRHDRTDQRASHQSSSSRLGTRQGERYETSCPKVPLSPPWLDPI